MSAIITKEDLKHEIEELDENYLELVLRLLKQFPHRPKPKLQDSSQEKKLSCLDLVQEDIGIIENAPCDLSTNPEYLAGYGQ